MKKLFKYIIIFIFAAGISFSCREDDPNIDLKREKRTAEDAEFSKLFIENFGNISADVSWILAEQRSVSVDVSGLKEGTVTIQVTTTDPRFVKDDCYLLAEYKNIEGTKQIKFDSPFGLDHVYISAIGSKDTGFVLRIKSNESSVSFGKNAIEYKPSDKTIPPMTYIIGYETYKNGADFDYNDIVLGVRPLNGSSSIQVALLAVGCRIPTKICYQRVSNTSKSQLETIFEEAHGALGFPAYYDITKKDYVYDAFNTGWSTIDIIPYESIDINSLESSIFDIASNLIAIFQPESKSPQMAYSPADKGSKYPEAMCVAWPMWAWPSEESDLAKVYPLFKQYVSSPKENPHWGDEIWAKANFMENDDITDNNPFGHELYIKDNLIDANQLKGFSSFSCELVVKISNLKEPTTLKLCKYPNIALMYIKEINIDKEGYCTFNISSNELTAIVDEVTLSQPSGLQFSYEGFTIDNIYIR